MDGCSDVPTNSQNISMNIPSETRFQGFEESDWSISTRNLSFDMSKLQTSPHTDQSMTSPLRQTPDGDLDPLITRLLISEATLKSKKKEREALHAHVDRMVHFRVGLTDLISIARRLVEMTDNPPSRPSRDIMDQVLAPTTAPCELEVKAYEGDGLPWEELSLWETRISMLQGIVWKVRKLDGIGWCILLGLKKMTLHMYIIYPNI